jgi:acetyltransferase-like isoleucine patch superfamily enzyme
MLNAIVRVTQRHLIPSVVSSLYYLFRYRCFINPKARVQFNGKISFGRGTVVKSFAIIQTGGGRIKIGENCAISSFNHISTNTADVVIGDHVRIGPHVTITGTTRNYRRKSMLIVDQGYTDIGIMIGNDVFIGSGVVITDGCEIGDGAVIGAGSIVTKDVSPYSVVFGVPARVIFNRQ